MDVPRNDQMPCPHPKAALKYIQRGERELTLCTACATWCDEADPATRHPLPLPKIERARAAKKRAEPAAGKTIAIVRRTPEHRASWMQGARYVLRLVEDDEVESNTIRFALDMLEELDAIDAGAAK